jgi:hypothetical protein
MSANAIFLLHLIFGYVAWLLLFGTYVLPWLRSMDRLAAQRVIATLHSFRFLGLVFLLPGVVGPNLPPGFSGFAAYGDLLTGLLAMTALMTVRLRPLFWLAVGAFNLVGLGDILLDYAHAIQNGLPNMAGQLGAAYWVPVLYVPILVLTHVVALYWLARPQAQLASVAS